MTTFVNELTVSVNCLVFLEALGFVTVSVNVWTLSCKIICVVVVVGLLSCLECSEMTVCWDGWQSKMVGKLGGCGCYRPRR